MHRANNGKLIKLAYETNGRRIVGILSEVAMRRILLQAVGEGKKVLREKYHHHSIDGSKGVSWSGLGPFSYQRLHFGDGLKQLVLITHDLSSFAGDTKYIT